MINWNEVKVGETEICRPSFTNRKVVGVFDDWVWLKDLSGYPCSYYKKDLTYWTIYDPWEEITDKCRFVKEEYTPASWHLMYGDLCIYHGSKKYKISEDGRRIWKRKEG